MDQQKDPRPLDVFFTVGPGPDGSPGLEPGGDRAADGGDGRQRRRTSRPVFVALALACAALLALAGLRYVEHRQSPTEAAIARAVEAYTDAWNAHDRDAVMAAMSGGANFAASETLQHPLLTAYSGPELDRLLDAMFRAGVRLETTGQLSVAGTDRSHASVTQRYQYGTRGLHVVEDGISLYTFAEVGRDLKITQHVWWRPRAATTPSMRWVIEEFSP
ncbi:MAG TPA: hypothetical protein VK453_17470 [Micromonosporaceae bacterium]|nr:hypothetical protein [Micromonosporaceae bacterium]